MACNTCGNIVGCCTCGSGTTCANPPAYYTNTPVCKEDNCQKIYCNQFSFAVCPCISWNIPQCGGSALLSVPGLKGASTGSYLWNVAYGYFEITSVDAEKGLLGIMNPCLTGNAAPGTQIPKGTCFVVTAAPPEATNPSDLFPYLALDFTAPAISDCIPITVTTINGLTVGDIISIGTGFYEIDSFISNTVINICNTGDGIIPGTPVVAQDQFGNYVYPIVVVSNCCESLTDAIVDSSYTWGGLSTGSANAQEISIPVPISTAIDGQNYRWAAGFTTTTTDPTLEIPNVSPITMRDSLGVRLFASDLEIGRVYETTSYASNVRVTNLPADRVVYRNSTATTVVNNAAATTISTVVIPAGVLYTGRSLRITTLATVTNTSGGSQFWAILLTYGGSGVGGALYGTHADGDTVSVVNTTYLAAVGAASQRWTSWYSLSASPSATAIQFSTTGTTAVNSAANQNLVLSIDLNAADPDYSGTITYQLIEYL